MNITAYLDNSATTKVCDSAVEAINNAIRNDYFNPSAVYAPAVDVMRQVREAREEILRAVKAKGAEVYFTSGGTESNNLAILGTEENLRVKKGFACSAVEHPSVKMPFDYLGQKGCTLHTIKVNRFGSFDLDDLAEIAKQGLSLVSVMQVNNETGAITPVEQIRKIIDDDVILHVDGVQGFLRDPFDMKYADLYTLSGHKIHAPKGIGALVASNRVRLHARQMGGGQQQDIRSGTENTPGILALRAAIREFGEDTEARERMMRLKLKLASQITAAIPQAVINGPEPSQGAPHIINISFPGMRGEVMLHALEAKGVLVSTGAACSAKKKNPSATLLAMGLSREIADSAIRFSLSRFTTDNEIDTASQAVADIYSALVHYKRS